ncbi:DUF805 domain-containing protein [Gemmobacter aquarius]|uniref:DUF805 domain-containing protein n=1 Tax=Paragemmobacter aquarius TaxID=2169400 RepID=A0A2S0UIA4_9RHOB|nr:DUF805 domain-containing protein [Gemmobacter aquarius]AWB47544.1 DUF805 domain-containing protein [Gemmobacter aquarius]
MNFQHAVRSVLFNYVTFSGRARRAEYWFWALFCVLANLALGILDGAIFGRNMMQHMDGSGPLSAVFTLLTLLPSIAVGVRRLHDIDRTGWWLLIVFLPLIGWILLLVWACTRGTIGPNRFGPDPVTEPQTA